MYSSDWNADQLTLLLRVFDPVIWTFHSSMAGRMLVYLVKFSRFSYLFRFWDATKAARNTPIVFGCSVLQWLVDFLLDRDPSTPNGDICYRRNSFFGRLADSGYTLPRIVDKDGNYTSAVPDMLSKVDSDCLIIAKEGKSLQKLPNPLH